MKLIIGGERYIIPFKIGDIVAIKQNRYGAIYYWDFVKTQPQLLKYCPYQYGEGHTSNYIDIEGMVKPDVPREWKIKQILCFSKYRCSVELSVVLVSREKHTLVIACHAKLNEPCATDRTCSLDNPPFEIINRDRKGVEEIEVEMINR